MNTLKGEIEGQLEAMENQLQELKKSLRFQGPYDDKDAIIRITSGAGGTEAMDWASMLERMYLRFFEKKGYFNKNIGNVEYYKVFLDFNDEVLQENNNFINEIVKFNYLLYNKKRGLPDFLRSGLSKEEDKEIKSKLREKYSFKEYYLEKFIIDLKKYVETNEIVIEESYYLFDNCGLYIKINM